MGRPAGRLGLGGQLLIEGSATRMHRCRLALGGGEHGDGVRHPVAAPPGSQALPHQFHRPFVIVADQHVARAAVGFEPQHHGGDGIGIVIDFAWRRLQALRRESAMSHEAVTAMVDIANDGRTAVRGDRQERRAPFDPAVIPGLRQDTLMLGAEAGHMQPLGRLGLPDHAFMRQIDGPFPGHIDISRDVMRPSVQRLG